MPAVVGEVALRQRHLVAPVRERLAVVAAFHHRDLVGGLAQFLGDLEHQVTRAGAGGHLEQDAAVEALARGAHRAVDVGARRRARPRR